MTVRRVPRSREIITSNDIIPDRDCPSDLLLLILSPICARHIARSAQIRSALSTPHSSFVESPPPPDLGPISPNAYSPCQPILHPPLVLHLWYCTLPLTHIGTVAITSISTMSFPVLAVQNKPKPEKPSDRAWWKSATVYQGEPGGPFCQS